VPTARARTANIINGLVYAADHGADVILMSFSNPGYSSALQAAVDYAWSKGAVLVAAAGNDSSSTATFPAGDRGVVGVSNTKQDDTLNSSSNTGDSVFLGAPGTAILTTEAGGDVRTITGTSASAAVVAGSAALLAANSSASNGVIVGRLARTADAAGTAAETGNGRVNLARALADDSTTAVKPAGAAPVASGGPYVGPYVIAAVSAEAGRTRRLVAGPPERSTEPTPHTTRVTRFRPVHLHQQVANSVHTVTLKLDVSSGTRHFADAFTSYNRTTGTAANPCPRVGRCDRADSGGQCDPGGSAAVESSASTTRRSQRSVRTRGQVRFDRSS
jgi:hypothetical protein